MKLNAQILAATIAASFMFAGGVEACSLAAWTGTAVGSPVVGEPVKADGSNAQKRYSGKCSLKPSADNVQSYVVDNNPATEGVYRARMYVFTGSPTASVKFFSATDADNLAGTEVISISYDGSAFGFNVGGVSASAPNIENNKWYSVEIVHSNGKPFTAKIAGAAKATSFKDNYTEVTGSSNSAGTIGSAALGVVSPAAGSGTMYFDQFDSTRNETTEIGRLCRGDVSSDNKLSVTDVTLIINEILPAPKPIVGAGQPDFSEDGKISVTDVTTLIPYILPPNNGTCPNS